MKRTRKIYNNKSTRKLKGGQKFKSTAKHPSLQIKAKHTQKTRCFTDTQLKLYCKNSKTQNNPYITYINKNTFVIFFKLAQQPIIKKNKNK